MESQNRLAATVRGEVSHNVFTRTAPFLQHGCQEFNVFGHAQVIIGKSIVCDTPYLISRFKSRSIPHFIPRLKSHSISRFVSRSFESSPPRKPL
jgi:hypothetical protein